MNWYSGRIKLLEHGATVARKAYGYVEYTTKCLKGVSKALNGDLLALGYSRRVVYVTQDVYFYF
jgi:hypothetical protein